MFLVIEEQDSTHRFNLLSLLVSEAHEWHAFTPEISKH